MQHKHQTHQKSHDKVMYRNLGIMMLLSFIAMYALMYAMVDKFSNVIPNVNQFYMAGLMSMPMLLIELLVMGHMYKNKKLNQILLVVGVIMSVAFFLGIREQVTVKDKQFVKSMIPHHAAAVLMEKKETLSDPEVKELAEKIIKSQNQEIEQMKSILKRLK